MKALNKIFRHPNSTGEFLAYDVRPILFKGLHKTDCYIWKCYTVCHESNTIPTSTEWTNAHTLVKIKRNEFARNLDDLHVGYIIYHKGFNSNYVVASWWSNQNMLRMFAFKSEIEYPNNFNLVENGLNICVWDLEIHKHERISYINHILLCTQSPQFEKYLNHVINH